VSVNAFPPKTGERCVNKMGIKRLRTVQEKEGRSSSVPKTATGPPGIIGEAAARLVVGEHREERDFATLLYIKERNVKDTQRRLQTATLMAVQWTALGVLGGPGVSAPSPVLERMVIMGKKLVSVNAIPPDTEERMTVIQPGLKIRMSVQEKISCSLSVPKTATGTNGVLGLPAAGLVVGEQKKERDFATNLDMEEMNVKETERRPQAATLMAVQLTAVGKNGRPGAAVA